MEQSKKPGVEVDGETYQLPTLDTITLDEERVLFIYSDTVVRDFIPAHPEVSDEEKKSYERLQLLKLRDPNFKKALAYIALLRAKPELDEAERRAKAGRVNALDADIAMLWGDEDPTQSSQKPLENKSNTSEPSSSTDSGSSTKNGSDHQEETLVSTGTSESETSSPGAPRIELVS